jgi:aspartyl/asparaginyl-tRNA synthetase
MKTSTDTWKVGVKDQMIPQEVTGDIAMKCDVIMGGMETIGSAERSSDTEKMREMFHTISDGMYANLLFKLFGKERVEKELDEFLSYDFFPRFGGGIGITRMISALDKLNSKK